MRILSIILSAIVLLALIAYLLLSFYAVKFIQARIQASLGPDFTITAVKVKLRELRIQGISCYDPSLHRKTLQAAELKIIPSIGSLLKGKIIVKNLTLTDPYLYVIRSAGGAMTGPWSRLPALKPSKSDPPPITVDAITIKNGSIDFEDHKTGSSPALLQFRNLASTIGTIHMPLEAGQHTPLHVRTMMKGVQSDGAVFVYGWSDIASGNQEVTLKINGVGVRTFEPYYRNKVSTLIKSGTVTMHMDLKARNKIIDAPGQLDLNGLSFDLGGPGVTELMGLLVPSSTLTARLQEKNNNLAIPFRVHGNESNPQFSFQNAFLAQVAAKLVGELGIKPGIRSFVPGLDSTARSTIQNLFKSLK